MQVGKKFDGDKSRLELLPPKALLLVGHVMAHGAKKYGDWNWTHIGDYTRYVGAAERHLVQRAIEKDDPESGLPHLAHAAASALIALEIELAKYGEYGDTGG